MWRKMSSEEVNNQISFENICGVNTTLQMMLAEGNKDVSLWTFNEGQCFEVRENVRS